MSILGRPAWAFIVTVAGSLVALSGCELNAPEDTATQREALLGVGGVLNLGGVVSLGGADSVGGVLNLGGVVGLGGTSSGGASSGGALSGVGGTLTSIACSQARDCDDDDSCTANLCVLNICATLPVLGCVLGAGGEPGLDLSCNQDAACDDGHPCTDNKCIAGLCVAAPVLGCCFQGNCVIGIGGTTQVEIGGSGNGGNGSGGNGGNGNVNGGTDSGGTESGGTESGGTDSGGTESGGTDSGGTDPGGADSGGTATAAGASAGSEAGGKSAAAGDGSGATAPSDGEAGAGAERASSPKGQTDWEMQGGGCSVSAPRGGGSAGLLALFLAGAVWARRRRRLASALVAAPLALAAGSADAAGFAQDSFTAPAAPDDLMWTERAGSNPGHLRPFARLTLGFADDPLVMVDANDSDREVRLVDDQFAAYGALGFGLFERAHLAVLMPLYVQSSSFAGAADNVKGTKPGDLGFDGRFTILDRTAPLELALAATLRVPTGDRDSFASDGSVSVWPRALVSKQLSESGSLVNLSVGPMFRPSNQEAGVQTGTQLRFSAGALIALTRILGLTGEVAGGTVTSDPSKRNTPLEGALGGRLTFSSVVLGTTLGTGLTEGVGSPDWRWLAMLAVPGPFVHEERPRAEPPEVDPDPDHDGVLGLADKCPTEAEDMDGFEDDDGCPEADNDVDGVPDANDKCPGEAEDKDDFQDTDGCPEADNDGDGVPDSADKCPAEPEDLDQWEDEDGCPEADNDGDGIPDAQDKCPNEPETKNGIDDEDGCPDLLRVEQGQIRTLEPIYFDTGKATIQARSEPLLLEMGNLIRSRADLGTIAIEGHTDNRGNARNNLKLSQERATAVRNFLIKAGVPESRLSSDGFGSERPLEENKTDAGRAKNRRVEFHFAPPTGAH